MSEDFYRASILPFAGIIIKICRAYTDSQQDFEDAYQEVCLQIWRSREGFRREAAQSTWVYRLALNVCLTQLKRTRRRRETVTTDDVADQRADVNTAFADDDLNRLYGAIRQLSEVDRAVILLHLEEKPYREIAEIIGTNANNIGVRITRIKGRLRRLLDGPSD